MSRAKDRKKKRGRRTFLDEHGGELLVDVLVEVDPVAANTGLPGESELASDKTWKRNSKSVDASSLTGEKERRTIDGTGEIGVRED